MTTTPSALVTHCGARAVGRDELARVPTPAATRTWFPVGHLAVLTTVTDTLRAAGFEPARECLALSRGDARFFATIDLETPLAEGVGLAVGVRNSLDKSLPIGFCAGSRVFVCDNLAFRAEVTVARKHTRFGEGRYAEALSRAVAGLAEFRAAEAERVRRFRAEPVSDERAESLILRAYEGGVISHRLLPEVLGQWREPPFAEFAPRTLWSLMNAFTAALAPRRASNPQEFARLTIRLGGLLGGAYDPARCAAPEAALSA